MTLMTRQPPSLCCYLTSGSSLQELLPITDFSQPLSVFLSVHPSFPFLLLSSHSLVLSVFSSRLVMNQQPFSYLTVFFIHPSIFLPYLFLLSSLMACCLSLSLSPSCEANTFPSKSIHLCPLLPCIILCLSFHCSLLFSIFDPNFLFCGMFRALLLILSSLFLYSFTFFSSSARAFAFDVHIFPSLNAAALMQRQVCLNCLSIL